MGDTLDDFLEPKTAEPQEVETTGEDAAEAERIAAEAAETERAAAAKAEEDARVKAFQRKAEDETRKRQAAEQALAAEQARKQKEVEDDDPYAAGIKQELQSQFQQQLLAQKLDLSESFARDKHADFDDKLTVFESMVAENPSLYHQMIQQANPAEFAYKTASAQLKMKEMANPEEYETKLREKIRAELKAEQEAEAAKRGELPGSLAGARGVAGTKMPTYAGPAPLSDILN